MNYADLEAKLKYKFNNLDLLKEALTHSSYAYEHPKSFGHNERLEYLGDAVLQLIISEALFKREEKLSEGSMTKLRARLVCEETLAEIAHDLKLQSYLKLGHGEQLSGGAKNDANLANAMEAVLGAIFLDSNYAESLAVTKELFSDYIDLALSGKLIYDYKSYLLEAAHKNNFAVEFKILEESGPDHDRRFKAGVFINGRLAASAVAKTKKDAEKKAAATFIKEDFHPATQGQ